MDTEYIKQFINNNCFTKTHKFNNRVCINSWWVNKNFTRQLEDIHKLYPADISLVQKIYNIIHDIAIIPACKCGNTLKFKNFQLGYNTYCSLTCSYSSDERNEKIRNNRNEQQKNLTMLSRYGVKSFRQLPEFQKMCRDTKLERYGKLNVNEEVRISTNLERYGSESYFSSETWAGVRSRKLKDNTGSLKLTPEINSAINNQELLTELNKEFDAVDIAEKLGVTPVTIHNKFKEYGLAYQSHNYRKFKLQNEFALKVKEIYKGTLILNDRVQLNGKELDIWIPEYRIAIEVNGLYWHQEEFIGADYHLDKHKLCENNNIRLLHVWDYEINNEKSLNIILSIIRNIVGASENKIGARRCTVHNLGAKEYFAFCEDNHIQGGRNASHRYGLKYNNELVSVMSLSRHPKYGYELVRFCNKLNYHVNGAARKLFNIFCNTVEPTSIVSYCDKRLFTGGVYTQLGFNHIWDSKPNFFYFYNNYNAIKNTKLVLMSRLKFQKHKLSESLEHYSTELSVKENIKMNKISKIYDCGNKVFVWKNNNIGNKV